jgi:hypothetical protein
VAGEQGRLVALVYLWNPAVLLGSAYWGQPDAVHAFLAVGAIAALAARRLFAAGLLLSAAVLTKPLAAPLVPLLVLVALCRRGVVGVLTTALGGLLGIVLIFFPYLVAENFVAVVRRTVLGFDIMPFTSVNAHNLWWLLGGWRPANEPLLGPLTPKMLGLAAFAAIFTWLAIARWDALREPGADPAEDRSLLFLHAAALGATFFFVSTHMHENHLFLAVPLLLLLLGRSRSLARLAIACSVAVFANELLHDPDLPHALPGWLGAASPVFDAHAQRHLTWVQLAGSFFNCLLVGWVTLGAALATARDNAGRDSV